ncbi:MAG: alpha/beta hydrolase [Bdellovibrio sp.]|jgi:esterase/lipase
MRRKRWWIRISVLIFLLLIAAGACFERPWYRPGPPQLGLTKNWTADLSAAEELIPSRHGQAKDITWALSRGQQTPWAFAYLHGFSASRKEISPTLEQISELMRANVFWSRLTQHGLDGEGFKSLSADDFFRDSEEAYQVLKEIGRNRVLVGTSTGGTLALAQALWHPDLTAIILISPNFGASKKEAWLAGGPLGPLMARLILGDYYEWKPKNERHGEYWTTKYRVEGLTALLDMVNAVKRMPVENLRVPCLVFLNESDSVIDPQKAAKFISRAPKNVCKIKWIKAEDHVLAGDTLSPSSTAEVVTEILAFLRTLPQP